MDNLPPNIRFAHYLIVSKLGEAGRGEVYLIQDTRLDREVAHKILPSALAIDAIRTVPA